LHSPTSETPPPSLYKRLTKFLTYKFFTAPPRGVS
jgi:hypothetical protein